MTKGDFRLEWLRGSALAVGGSRWGVVRLAPYSGWRRGFDWCGLNHEGVSDSGL